MGKKTLEFVYFFLMISNENYVIHINDDNDIAFVNCVQIKCGQTNTVVTKPLYRLSKIIKSRLRRLLEIT